MMPPERVTLEGLRATVDWYVRNQELMSEVYSKDYVGQRLGLGGVE